MEIAVEFAEKAKLPPLNWLKVKWKEYIDSVIKCSRNKGLTLNQNTVGNITEVEAKQALIKSTEAFPARIQQAVDRCVKQRQETVSSHQIKNFVYCKVL